MRRTGLYIFSFFFIFSLLACGNTESAMEPLVNVSKQKTGIAPGVKVHSSLVTFVEIGSLRCIPCKMMQPVMEKVAAKYGKKVKIVFHDVWTPEGRPYAKKYGIRAIPTQVFLDKGGKEFFRHTGFFPFEKIEALLASHGVK